MTTARHQYIDPMAKPKPPKVKYVSTWNDRERRTIRILMVAVALFSVIAAVGGVYLIDLGSKTQDTIRHGRADRIDFQNSIQSQANQNKKDIQDLACYAANAAPRGTSPFLDGLATKYNCPPYRKSAVTPKRSVSPGSTPSNNSSGARQNSSLSTAPIARGGGAGQTSSSPLQPSGGGSSSTPTPSPDLTDTVCKLLRLPC